MLTVVVLARNEADRITAAVSSGLEVGPVLVLDSGSTDDTVALARAAGAEVVQTDWPGFVEQRNRALQRVETEWVLFLDADERLEGFAAPSGEHDGYRLRRANSWLGQAVGYGTFGSDRPLRLVRRARARCEGRGVHEVLVVEGSVGTAAGVIRHEPYRDLGEHLATIDRYSRLFAESSERRAGWWDVVLRPPLHFVKAYLLKLGFLDGVVGLQLAWLGSMHVALKWGRLYARRQ
ncbi:MAG TPA: glycosyltransferase family 2 protein [Myxococcota bacterium]|nr:glycosyltransferase family 2 protein [Myxococcota bacterium]